MGDICLSVRLRTHRGRVRAENQDSYMVLDLAGGASGDGVPRGSGDAETVANSGDFALGPEGAVFLVADGMGGRAGGALASRMAAATVRDALLSDADASTANGGDFPRRLAEALVAANAAIHDESARSAEHAGMGTTATLAGVQGDRVYVAQVGDSRAYLLRRDEIARLTRDQSLMQDLIDSGVFSEDDELLGSNNMILQALGTAPDVDPAVTYHELRRGDVLLLCSDGLSGVVKDDEIRDAAARAPSEQALCDRLVELANDRGGPDNITVVTVRFEGVGLPEPTSEEVVTRKPYEA